MNNIKAIPPAPELLARYLHAVGKRLPEKGREDILRQKDVFDVKAAPKSPFVVPFHCPRGSRGTPPREPSGCKQNDTAD